jgi:hypothetical protein
MKAYNKIGLLVIILVMILVSLSACQPPYPKTILADIAANETAFLIPLVGDTTNQVKLQSVDFLKSKQVPVKRVEIPVTPHQLRNATIFDPYPTEYIPAAILIKVDRTPVTREWTVKKDTGTTSTNQAFGVETKESIGFYVGATCSALVTEEDAATFLYFFASKPLAQVMDENVRGFVQTQFFSKIGDMMLDTARNSKSVIMTQTFDAMKDQFKPMGITFTSFGGSEGYIYDSDAVQKSIDDTFVTQQGVLNSYQQATKQAVDNTIMLGKADAYATATVVAGNAGAQVLKAQGEELAKYPSITNYTLAQKSTGQVPTFLIVGGDGATNTLPFGFFLQPDGSFSNAAPTPVPSTTVPPTPVPSPTLAPSPTATQKP